MIADQQECEEFLKSKEATTTNKWLGRENGRHNSAVSPLLYSLIDLQFDTCVIKCTYIYFRVCLSTEMAYGLI